jgi:hypothetical protein
MSFLLFAVTAMLVTYAFEARSHWITRVGRSLRLARRTAFFKARGRSVWSKPSGRWSA